MKLTFLGTRGFIEASTPRHARHSVLEVACGNNRVLIDWGEDWRDEPFARRPDAIFLTHAHPDHAWGLKGGAPCPVHATAETWGVIDDYPLADRRLVAPGEPVEIGGLLLIPFPVQHSFRAPAVGYRIESSGVAVFYAPDLVRIEERRRALSGVRLFIGDGAAVEMPKTRIEDGQLCGHAPVSTQLDWCRKEGVAKMLVTHCGNEIVTGEESGVLDLIQVLGRERGVEVEVAWDGMEVVLTPPPARL